MVLKIESTGKCIVKAFDSAFLVLPFASLHPLRLYLSLATSLIIHQDRSILRKVHLLNVILLVNLFKTIYLSVFLPANPLDRIRLVDFMYITTGEDVSYRIWILLQGMLLYFNYTIFTVKPVFLRFLKNVLFNQTQPLLREINQKSRSPLKNPRQSALWAINAIGLLKLISDTIFLIVCATIVNKAIDYPDDFLANPLVSPFLFSWRILQLTVGFTGFFLPFFLYATVCTNVAAFGLATLTLLFLRLRHSAKQLTAWKLSFRPNFTWTPLSGYRAYSTETFRYLFIANSVFGRLFVAFLTVNLPVSAFCFVYLALGGLNLKTTLTFILITLQGLVCTLNIHWILARLTKRLHAPSKPLLSLSTLTSHRIGNFRARLTLHLAICYLHTNRKYGFTYGPFGLVTMDSFSKCMLLYYKLVIYSYKLIKSI